MKFGRLGQYAASFRRGDHFIWHYLAAGLIGLAGVMVAVQPPVFTSNGGLYGVPWIVVFVFAVYRPTSLPASLSFTLGLLLDALTGQPFGVNAMVLVLLRAAVGSQREVLSREPFWVIWVAFAASAIMAALFKWSLIGLFTLSLPPLQAPVMTALVAWCLFPPLASGIVFINRQPARL